MKRIELTILAIVLVTCAVVVVGMVSSYNRCSDRGLVAVRGVFGKTVCVTAERAP